MGLEDMSLVAITSSELNSSARRVEVFKDTYTEASKWLQEKRDLLQKTGGHREEFSVVFQPDSIVVKGENPMAPDTMTVYRIEQFTLAEALNYLLGRIR